MLVIAVFLFFSGNFLGGEGVRVGCGSDRYLVCGTDAMAHNLPKCSFSAVTVRSWNVDKRRDPEADQKSWRSELPLVQLALKRHLLSGLRQGWFWSGEHTGAYRENLLEHSLRFSNRISDTNAGTRSGWPYIAHWQALLDCVFYSQRLLVQAAGTSYVAVELEHVPECRPCLGDNATRGRKFFGRVFSRRNRPIIREDFSEIINGLSKSFSYNH
jgi:hypothetical protein